MKKRLTEERQKRGWSKTRLGFEARIPNAIIGQLESGKIYPYPAYKSRLSKVLGVEADKLFEEVSENGISE